MRKEARVRVDSLRGDCVVFRVATVFDSQNLWLVCDQRFRIIRTQGDSEKKGKPGE